MSRIKIYWTNKYDLQSPVEEELSTIPWDKYLLVSLVVHFAFDSVHVINLYVVIYALS